MEGKKRLNIWINMHILCCQSHMERAVQYSANRPCNNEKKPLPSLFALFTLPIGDGSNSLLLKRKKERRHNH